MKYNILAIAVFCVLSAGATHAISINCGKKDSHCQLLNEDQPNASLLDMYAASVLPGIATGALSGSVCAIFSKKFPEVWVLVWLLEIFQRETIVSLISSDMKQKDIEHNKQLMELAAWISSWLSYLHVE